MKKIVLAAFTLISLSCFAKTYHCDFQSSEGSGEATVKTYKTNAHIKLKLDNKTYHYKDCEKSIDTYGLLVDCSDREMDLMLLINKTSRSNRAGIMSGAFNLFVDLDC